MLNIEFFFFRFIYYNFCLNNEYFSVFSIFIFPRLFTELSPRFKSERDKLFNLNFVYSILDWLFLNFVHYWPSDRQLDKYAPLPPLIITNFRRQFYYFSMTISCFLISWTTTLILVLIMIISSFLKFKSKIFN